MFPWRKKKPVEPKKPAELKPKTLGQLTPDELMRYAPRWQKYALDLEDGATHLAKAGAALAEGFKQATIYFKMIAADAEELALKEKADRLEWQAIARELLEENNAR